MNTMNRRSCPERREGMAENAMSFRVTSILCRHDLDLTSPGRYVAEVAFHGGSSPRLVKSTRRLQQVPSSAHIQEML